MGILWARNAWAILRLISPNLSFPLLEPELQLYWPLWLLLWLHDTYRQKPSGNFGKKTIFITLEGTQHVLGHTARSQEREKDNMDLGFSLYWGLRLGCLGFLRCTIWEIKTWEEKSRVAQSNGHLLRLVMAFQKGNFLCGAAWLFIWLCYK